MKQQKMPIGIQDFEKLRTSGYVYVDKTEHLYRLTRESIAYFLGRPRRFGKSLLLSAIKYYFLGRKDLFEGLAIAKLEKDWTEHPVFYIDFNTSDYLGGLTTLEACLDRSLREIEAFWGKDEHDTTPALRFFALIKRAYEKSSKRVVVLIDEYDKPLLDTIDKPDENEKIREQLRGFYGILKSADQYLRFVMLTGVTKFAQVNVFSQKAILVIIGFKPVRRLF